MRLPVPLAAGLVLTVFPLGFSPAQAADGCAPGTSSTVTSPDGNATSVLFDDFSVGAGGTAGIARATTTCNLSIAVTQPKGYSVFAVDYRGFVTVENGQTATITSGKPGEQKTIRTNIDGATQEDFQTGEQIGSFGSDTVQLGVTIIAEGPINETDFAAGLFLDTIDFARIGFTTIDSVTASLDQLANQRQAVAIDLMDTAQLMLGGYQSIQGETSLSLFGSSNGPAAGFNGRWEAGNGFTLLGGAALSASGNTDIDRDSALLMAGGVRYLSPESGLPLRAFGEIGAWGSPDMAIRFSRSYFDTGRMVSSTGTDEGTLFSTYGRIGAIYAPDNANELALSARYTRSWLDLDGYSEAASRANLFAATVAGQRTITDTVAAEIGWTHDTGGKLDYTLSAALGRTFGTSAGARADIAWVGSIDGRSQDRDFAAIGGRLGWKFDERWKVDATLSATFREGDKPKLDIGGQLKASF
ncbi:DUF4360 domain-containing protein [Pararhizobium antarcticum]|uniref:Autotransporter domain-containing protein n=1 Tax=Pararhizobium antarcticum TaxID=1798805 RepID=A0A657LQS1_9HYPH|nr:DUF4360 domain-containing protein [Pararhizobium antarcticum]OJF93968.1 hypothetical protein AX761_19410 [Rhizobium sp. 58]OJF94080.1 hypothetical protein AX760_20805 [Pararhizobium antarcticum]